jgi:uncharacterized protein DUF1559
MNRSVIRIVLCGVVLGLLLFDSGRTLLFGWIGFLLRVLPKVSSDGATVGATVVAVVLFTLGVQWLGRAWMRHRRPDGPPWKLRWSTTTTVLFFMMFISGVAMVGILHMTYWYFTDPEPVLGPSFIGGAVARARTENGMKQIELSFHNYHSVSDRFPSAATLTPDGKLLQSWETQSIIFLAYTPGPIDAKLPWDDSRNAPHFKAVIPEFINESLFGAPVHDENGFGLNHYSANSHVIQAGRSLRLEDIGDGTAITFLLGETNANFSPWGKPMNVRDPALGINKSPNGFGGPNDAHGAYMAMCDGSVRFFSEKTSPEVMRALATPNGGEEIDPSVLK